MAEGRYARSHLARRRAESRKAGLDFFITAVRRLAGFHEDRARRRSDGRRHQIRVSRSRFPAYAAEEGVHARRYGLRPQHAVLRSCEREPAAKAIRAGIRSE